MSDASNLVAGDTNRASDVFVRDRVAGTTKRVSVSSDGAQANTTEDGSGWPALSADGRFVAFWSDASNLVAGDSNDSTDVFLRDRVAGTTERVSVSRTGVQASPTDEGSGRPAISADGRLVAFVSSASNLVAGDTNDNDDAFARDRVSGTTELVSVGRKWVPQAARPALRPWPARAGQTLSATMSVPSGGRPGAAGAGEVRRDARRTQASGERAPFRGQRGPLRVAHSENRPRQAAGGIGLSDYAGRDGEQTVRGKRTLGGDGDKGEGDCEVPLSCCAAWTARDSNRASRACQGLKRLLGPERRRLILAAWSGRPGARSAAGRLTTTPGGGGRS